MNIYSFNQEQILFFALVLIRIIAFIISSAIFGSQNVSSVIKILFSITLAVIIFPIVKNQYNNSNLISENILSFSTREILVGLFLGFLTRIFFFTISMVGELASLSMGLSAAQIFNPMMGSHGNIMEQYFSIIGTLMFFAINGHHIFISGILQSFQIISPGELGFNLGVLGESTHVIQELFIITIKISAPVLVAVLVTNVAMGIIGRAVPQINVLVTSMPIIFALGMAITIVSLPLFFNEVDSLVSMTSNFLFQVMKHI